MPDLKAQLQQLGVQVNEGEVWMLQSADLPPLHLKVSGPVWELRLTCPIPEGADAIRAARTFTVTYGGRVTQRGMNLSVQTPFAPSPDVQRLLTAWRILALLPSHLERTVESTIERQD